MKFIYSILFIMLIGLMGCARIGSPDGGPYDETPPMLVATTPVERAYNAKSHKIELAFNEYVKLENAVEKVVVSPPQIQMPEIKEGGKKITIELFDSLKVNTTYTIDFGDAIIDNNEGNPLGNYTFLFSTSSHIDTMEVSGYLLNAMNLEPIKGVLVGLHSNFSDTAFTKLPFDRVARTNDRGRFVIKGVADKKYRIYALKDVDGNYRFNQKSESIAFSHDSIKPSSFLDIRNDTIWRDSTRIDSIKVYPYVHYKPDDIVLLAFSEVNDQRHLLKLEHTVPQFFKTYFTAPSDSLPQVKGLNFDASNAFMVEASVGKDTLCYWLKDTTLLYQDTLRFAYTYAAANDSTFLLEMKTDTLDLVPRITYKKQLENSAKAWAEWKKKEEKRKKKYPDRLPEQPPINWLKLKTFIPSGISPIQNPSFIVEEPLSQIDTSAIHLLLGPDSLQVKANYILKNDSINFRKFSIYGAWRPEQHYTLKIDSAAMKSIFGNVNRAVEYKFVVRREESFGTLFVNLPKSFNGSIVQLLSSSDKPRAQVEVKDGVAEFYYVNEGDYYLRLFVDDNNNGQWDTGNYNKNIQPERVYYFPSQIKIPKRWDVSQDWNPTAVPIYRQKPLKITKQKPTEKRRKINRNAERERMKNN